MRRLSAVVLVGLMLSGCAVYVPVNQGGMYQGRAVEIAYGFTRQHGFNPTGTRYAVYNHRNYWKVSLWLGPPSCGAASMRIDAYNGRVFDFVPYVRNCGGPPPVIEEDRQDL